MKTQVPPFIIMPPAKLGVLTTFLPLTNGGGQEFSEVDMLRYGRKIIYSDAHAISAANVVAELKLASAVHEINEKDEKQLWDYYRGVTPILNKTNNVRDDINNTVNENRASEIVTFQTGFLLGEPIQYIGRSSDEQISDMICMLNSYMEAEDKAALDNELAKWAHICGTSYRLTLPDADADVELTEAPFTIMVPEPWNAFVIYSSSVHKRPLAGVIIVRHRNGTYDYNVYTKTDYFLIKGSDWTIVEHKQILNDEVALIEYPLNSERMGAFEKVIPLLDALNVIQSERVDNVEQFVKAFLVLIGTELSEEQINAFKKHLMLFLPQDTDAKYVTASLNQADVQTLKDDIINSINEICCMPNRNGGSSTSDTGAAVIYRDGWQDAETNAQNTELSFRVPEKRFLRLVLGICRNRQDAPVDLSLGDVDVKFTRRNFANLSAKVSAFATLANIANQGLLHLKDAFSLSTLFPDPESAFANALKWAEAVMAKQAQDESDESIDSEPKLEGSDGGESSAA